MVGDHRWMNLGSPEVTRYTDNSQIRIKARCRAIGHHQLRCCLPKRRSTTLGILLIVKSETELSVLK